MLSFLCLLFSLLLITQSRTVAEVFQFPNTSFTVVENLAVRSNGVILMNTITGANTWVIDPLAANPVAQLLYSFPGAGSLTGIAEVFPDVFAIASGNFTLATRTGIVGTFSVWRLDIRLPGAPIVTKVTDIPAASTLNSVCFLSPGKVLIADSTLGAVWRVDTVTGAYQIVIDDPMLKPTPTFALGINGLEVHKNKLYFTNSAQGIFGVVRINNQGLPQGPLTALASPFVPDPPFPGYPVFIYDDFAIDRDGKSWITNHPNAVSSYNPVNGNQRIIASGPEIIQPTSAAFGRSSQEERCNLYVVTAGTFFNISFIESGQLLRINVC